MPKTSEERSALRAEHIARIAHGEREAERTSLRSQFVARALLHGLDDPRTREAFERFKGAM